LSYGRLSRGRKSTLLIKAN